MDKPGYHINNIPKGAIGTSSKILEEVLELQDAEKQKCKIMALIELSDIVGSIKMYLKHNHPDISLNDLDTMSTITERAFVNGHRPSTEVPHGIVSKLLPNSNYDLVPFHRWEKLSDDISKKLPGEIRDYAIKKIIDDVPYNVLDFSSLVSQEHITTLKEIIYENKLQDYFIGL